MDHYIFLELFRWCTRGEIELQQAVCKSMCETITAYTNELPLRTIHKVVLDPVVDKVEIYLTEQKEFEMDPEFATSLTDGDFEEALHWLQHSRIQCFALHVLDSLFMRHWSERETDFVVEHIDFLPLDDVDYETLDSTVKLLARDSLLSILETCTLDVSGDGFPPPAFILQEPGYPNYELVCIGSKTVDWIDGFIESFDRDGCANKKLKSVCVRWDVCGHGQSPPPRSQLKQLNQPTKADVPLPKTEMVMHLIPRDHKVSQCEVKIFMNAQQSKRMEVHEWSMKYWGHSSRVTTHILLCRLKNV